MAEGWIKLHRSITNHWIFNDPEKLKAWICILINVNHSGKKVLIGDMLLNCDRGDSLNSLDSWAKLFGNKWNKSKVRRFFILLEKDSMIVTKSERKTTRLTVCKYDSYQDERNASETQLKRKRNASETQVTPNKNEKNEKNEKEIDIFLNEFKIITGKKVRVVDDKTKRQFNARIKEGYTMGDIMKAVKNCHGDKYHIENPQFLTMEFITRSDKLQKYVNADKSHSLKEDENLPSHLKGMVY